MNPQHMLIGNACRVAVLDGETNHFTENQKIELLALLDKFEATNPKNIFKFTINMKKFESAFLKYGGNEEKLKESLKKIKDDMLIIAAKAVKKVCPKMKLIKDGKEL